MSGKEEFGHDQFFAKKEVLFRPLEVAFFMRMGLGSTIMGMKIGLLVPKRLYVIPEV